MAEPYRYCPLCGSNLVECEYDGASRKCCPSKECDFVHWDNPVPVVAAIVEHESKVVLARNRDWPEKMFGVVTGFLEHGETAEQAVLREVREELGLAGELISEVGHYSFFEMNQLIIAFHVKTAGEIILGDELVEYKLVSPDKLKPWPMGTGPAVRDWLADRSASMNEIEKEDR